MTDRSRIDPQSRVPLDQLLELMPGGFNAIPDIVTRRATLTAMLQAMTADLPANERVVREDRSVPGPEGAPEVGLAVFRPAGAEGVLPVVYLIHGGGMVLGDVEGERLTAEMLCESLGAAVVSVEYRLAPEHPHPAPSEDCYAGLVWVAAHADELGVDPGRLAVVGGSAGGGLALAVTLMAHDRGGPPVAFQMPFYPMIDDRNTTASSHDVTDVGIWDRAANLEAWEWYLGGKEADAYAAPARAEDLTGLPPTFIDVGDVDLFRDEDLAFATRLLAAGVPTELHLYPGAYHASEVFAPEAELSAQIWATRIAALRRALVPAVEPVEVAAQGTAGERAR